MDVNREEYINSDGNPEIIVSSTKRKSKFRVVKTNDGFAHFEVKVDKGALPQVLNTRFTSLYKAADAIEEYLRTSRESSTVRRDNFGEEYDKRKKEAAS